MTEQMTVMGVVVLCGAICLFWAAIVLTIRVHRQHRDCSDVEAQR